MIRAAYARDVTARPADPEPEPSYLRLVQEVASLWFEMQARLQAHFAELAGRHSLSAIQAKVLIQLDQGGSVTTRALAGRLQYDPSNLTSVIDRLEELGLVRRRPDARDRRVKGIVLTGKGLQLRAAFWEQLTGDAGPLGALRASELATLRALLQQALNAPNHSAGSVPGPQPTGEPHPTGGQPPTGSGPDGYAPLGR